MSGYLRAIALLSAYPRAAHAAHAYSRSAYAPFRSAEASAPQRTSVLECLHEPYPFNQHEQHAGQQRGHLEDIRMRMEERIAAKLSYQTDLARDYAGQTGTTSYQTHAYSDHMQNQQPIMGGELIRPIASEAEYHDAINQAAAANRVVVIKIVGKFCRACRCEGATERWVHMSVGSPPWPRSLASLTPSAAALPCVQGARAQVPAGRPTVVS